MKKYDVVVVGAGVSGLLSALALSKEGKKVLLLEKGDKLGGNIKSYKVNGYLVDTGPHTITMLSNGPFTFLMKKYSNLIPNFRKYGYYYIRQNKKLMKLPWTLQDWARFRALPKKDRLILAQAITRSSITSAFARKPLNKSVYEFLSKYPLSEKTWRFVDAFSYFLTGKSMKETPAWRMLTGGGYMEDSQEDIKNYFYKFMKFAKHDGGAEHGYPLGGMQTLVNSITGSFNGVEIMTNQEITNLIVNDNKIKGVSTKEDNYYADTVVYSGFMKDLTGLTDAFSEQYTAMLNRLQQSKTLTVWLGLKRKIKALDYLGSEIYFGEGLPYWGVPVSNFDGALAPKDKQLIGFGSPLKSNSQNSGKKKLLENVYGAIPDIEKNVELVHTQVTVPEKAAIVVDTELPKPKSPVSGLYLVGTDTDYRSMGVTRAAYSVIEALKYMKQDKVI